MTERPGGLRPNRLAVVLSGGGARGAYEVGVLSYIFDELSALLGHRIHVDVICGTSVGAINSAALAASMSEQQKGMQHLVQLWQNLRLDQVMGFRLRQVASFTGMFGTGFGTGLVDVSPMAQLIKRQVPWPAISRAMRRRHLRALSITCTEVRTGRAVLFMQTGPGTMLPSHSLPRTLLRAERIGPSHVLASASIPLIFPPVRVGAHLYVDGGLRHNTPVAPALRMGATHILVVGTSRELGGVIEPDESQGLTVASVAGKIMNALLLDHLDNDLHQVAIFNELFEVGSEAFGPQYGEKMRRAAALRGGRMFEKVEMLVLRPSVSLGTLGAEYLKSRKRRTGSPVMGRLLEWLDAGEEADLASYLLFEGDFAKQLIALGRSDAQAQRDRIIDFLAQVARQEEGGDPSMDPEISFEQPAVG